MFAGEEGRQVRDGNILAARVLVLCLLASAKALFWILEQPASSIMYLHPCFQYVMKTVPVHRLRINMSNYGAPTKKTTWLYTSHECLADIQEFTVPEKLVKREMAVKYTNGKGESHAHGGKDLRSSQSYPVEFGQAVSKCRTLHSKVNFSKAKRFLVW